MMLIRVSEYWRLRLVAESVELVPLKEVLDLTAGECMTRSPKTVGAEEFAATALNLMEQKKITSLAVVDGEGRLAGIIHLHDLWGTEMM